MEDVRTVLVLDDSKTFLEDFDSLMSSTFVVLQAQTERDALEHLSRKKVDVMFLDLMLGDGQSGLDVLVRVKEILPDLPVIMLTAHADVETAVEAMRLGAFHYVSKSPKIEELKTLIDKSLAERTLKRDYQVLREEVQRVSGKIVGNGAAMQELLLSIHRVAMTDVTVLISGESGTGKELVAREIHMASKRHERAFVAVNCGSLVKDLVESELFGHVKGSFTGATQTKLGKFELADGGTIFLDEIGDLDNHAQVKLLRVLQEKEIDRVGGTTPIPVNVRVIAATNRDLFAMTQKSEFREDLFYRLNVFPISIPPLRQHKEDIPLLVEHFLRQYEVQLSRPKLRVSPMALEHLMEYSWPGNIRELENIIQRAILLSPTNIVEPEYLPKEIAEIRVPISESLSLPQLEREAKERASRLAILRALDQNEWDIREAARSLGIPEKTLYDKCSKLGIKLRKKA
ncbi:MAG: sigma-54-dependent Fis family transcriptional regulator [Ignavibacteriales bacterium]|nr:sigma-54-dependent Fis family transcriptional regulator [Ignavibacteriales bacterium]